MPWREGSTQGRPPFDQPRGPDPRRRQRQRDQPQQARRQRPAPDAQLQGRPPPDAARWQAAQGADRHARRVDRNGRPLQSGSRDQGHRGTRERVQQQGQRRSPPLLGVSIHRPPPTAPGRQHRLVEEPDRRLHLCEAFGERPEAERRGLASRVDPPRLLRSDRTAPHARRGEGLRERSGGDRQGLRNDCRPPSRQTAIRGEVGTPLAGPGALRRDQRLRARQSETRGLALSRLRHPRVQPGQALRSLHQGATRRG